MLWADCGAGVGLGHVGRAPPRGDEAMMMLPEADGEELIAGESLPAPRAGDFQEFVAHALRTHADIAVLDSYRLPPGAATALRSRGITVAAFDDEGRDDAAADVIINGAPGADARIERRRADATYLVGAAFFPLRRALAGLRRPRSISDTVGAVVATVGGEDVHGCLRQMVEASLAAFPGATVRAVRVRGASLEGLPAHVDVSPADSRFGASLQAADVVVCGGGQTLVEAAALGTPAAAMLLGEDQRSQHRAVVAAGAAVDAGSWEQPRERQRAMLAGALTAIAPREVRRAMSESGRALIDGGGAARVAAALAGVAAGRTS
jgi:spore coat polysaccharide biosynthesis predicted glycosyltransferase SpsG